MIIDAIQMVTAKQSQMKTILVIDDNYEIRENTAELLELEGFSVLMASSGSTGVVLAIESKPDVILCDIRMPDTNGYEVFKALKKHEVTAAIPFIFLTASAERREVEAGMGLGAYGYISKPFETTELVDTIKRCLYGDLKNV